MKNVEYEFATNVTLTVGDKSYIFKTTRKTQRFLLNMLSVAISKYLRLCKVGQKK